MSSRRHYFLRRRIFNPLLSAKGKLFYRGSTRPYRRSDRWVLGKSSIQSYLEAGREEREGRGILLRNPPAKIIFACFSEYSLCSGPPDGAAPDDLRSRAYLLSRRPYGGYEFIYRRDAPAPTKKHTTKAEPIDPRNKPKISPSTKIMASPLKIYFSMVRAEGIEPP